MELDGSKLKSTTYFIYTVDLRTGKGVLNICSDYSGSTYADWKPSQIIRTVEAQVGVPIPIAAIQTALPNNVGEFLMNAIVAAGTQFGGFDQLFNTIKTDVKSDVSNAVASAKEYNKSIAYKGLAEISKTSTVDLSQSATVGDLSKIATAALSMKSTLEMVGSQGTISLNSRNPFAFWALCYTPADANTTLFGRPLCASVALNTLSGYVLCDNPKLQINYALETEVAAIENLLASGVFIE